MRSHGASRVVPAGGLHDHVCWAYRSAGERLDLAATWLAAGRALGQQAVYVGPDDAASVHERVAAPGDAAEAFLAFAIEELYDLSRPIVIDEQHERYGAAVARALELGYTGVRVFADITHLIEDPSRLDDHARWEHHADRWIASGLPLAPMCVFDESAVPTPRVVCALHPVRAEAIDAPFGLAADDSALYLDGEIDALELGLLEQVLGLAAGPSPERIDLSAVTFIDGRSAATLRAGEAEGRWELVNASPIVRRTWELSGAGAVGA